MQLRLINADTFCKNNFKRGLLLGLWNANMRILVRKQSYSFFVNNPSFLHKVGYQREDDHGKKFCWNLFRSLLITFFAIICDDALQTSHAVVSACSKTLIELKK